LESIFKDEIRIAQIKTGLAEVKRSLDAGGASQKAAKLVLESLNS